MAIHGRTLLRRDSLQRLGRFMTVGAIGTLLDFGLFTALRILLGLPVLGANTLSYSAGIVNNYTLHRHWTYGGRSRKTVGLQFAQFAAVSLCALAVNTLVVVLLAPPLGARLGSTALGDVLAKVYATGVGMCWSYLVNNFWTFRDATRAS